VVHTVRSLDTDVLILTASDFVYSLFGLNICTNLALPEISLIQLVSGSPVNRKNLVHEIPTVEIHLAMKPDGLDPVPSLDEELWYATEDRDQTGRAALRIWKTTDRRFLRLEYFDGTTFWLDIQGRQIWATWPDPLTLEDTSTYLLGPVLGLLLRLRGVTCLHASAVSFGDFAVAFIGSEGAGKSTTAAALAQQGCAIITDDVVALAETDDVFYVHPAYPYLCLWPESVASIYGSAEALPRFSPAYDKRCLSLERQGLSFEFRTLPLKAIYILGERRSDPAPAIEPLADQIAILALVANTFATNVLDSAMRAEEFKTLGRLVPRIRIRKVFPHRDVDRLPDLCRAIREDVDGPNDELPGRLDTAGTE
jgi:hypothetical protein